MPKRGKGLLSKNAVFGNVPVVAGGLEPSTYHNVANTVAPSSRYICFRCKFGICLVYGIYQFGHPTHLILIVL